MIRIGCLYDLRALPDEIHECVLNLWIVAEAARLVSDLPGIDGIGILELLYDSLEMFVVEVLRFFVRDES